MNFIIFFLIYNLFYFLLDFFYKKFGREELFRKIAHIWTWLITFFSLDFLILVDYLFLTIFFLIEFIFIKKFKLLDFISSNKRWNWDIFFILGQSILIIFPLQSLVITKLWLLILTFSDWLTPFWKLLFRKKIYREKTIWGSIIFFLISLFIISFYFKLSLVLIFIIFLITLVELFSIKWLDNIFIPIFTILFFYIYDKIFYL